jgi:hypothetical protein
LELVLTRVTDPKTLEAMACREGLNLAMDLLPRRIRVASDEGMIQWVLIFVLCGFRPRSKPFEGMIEDHRGADGASHEAETWRALQKLEGEDLVVFLPI